MAYTLDELVQTCRSALRDKPADEAQQEILQSVKHALRDPVFLDSHLGAHANKERDILYEDPDYDFCVCAHVYSGAKGGQPHDHGPTWAIYGQAEGETEMSDWAVTQAPTGTAATKVSKVKTYTLRPGDAHLYRTGDIHSPARSGPTKLLRVEGKNTEKVQRTPIVPA